MAEKLVVGPENFILSKEAYPITFATMSAIEEYTKAVAEAKASYNKSVFEADKRLKDAEEAALDKLKGELK